MFKPNSRVLEIFEKVDRARTVNEVYRLLAELIGSPFSVDDPSHLLPYLLVYKAVEDADTKLVMPKKIFKEIWSVPVGDTILLARKNDTLMVYHQFGVVGDQDDVPVRYFKITIASL